MIYLLNSRRLEVKYHGSNGNEIKHGSLQETGSEVSGNCVKYS